MRRDTPDPVSVEQLLARYPWPVAEAERIIYGPTPACAHGESGGDAGAVSATGDYGIMEIHYDAHKDKLYAVTGSFDITLLFDPAINIAVGYLVWRDSGGQSFSPWSCAP